MLGWYDHRNLGDKLMLCGLKELFKDCEVQSFNAETFSFEAVNKCDLFVLGGGELIYKDRLFMHCPTLGGFHVPLTFYRIANRLHLPLHLSWLNKVKISKVILGCGVNSYGFKKHTVKELEQFNYIGLRDKEGVNMLRLFPTLHKKVELFYDPAFSAPLEPEPVDFKKSTVIICPTERPNLTQGLINHASLKVETKDYEYAVFLPFGAEDNNDYETCRKLMSCHKNSTVYRREALTIQKVVNLIAGCDKVVAWRLHAYLLAYMLKKPVAIHPYHNKLWKAQDTLNVEPDYIRQKQKEIVESLK